MPSSGSSSHPARFAETHWSLIREARRADGGGAEALNQLCRCYRLPLYTYVRHRGFSPVDAEDITQSFFLDLLAREAFHRADPQKGRFRAFLCGSLKNFLANEWDRRRTLKRGGAHTFVSLDEPQAEALYGEMGAPGLDPERMFDRAWALRFVNRAVDELRKEYQAEGQIEVFEVLEPLLTLDGKEAPYADLARQLSATSGAVRMMAVRMRRRFRKILRREAAKTVTDPADADDELRYLFSCL